MRFFSLVLSFSLFFSCSHTPLQSSALAENNRERLMNLQVGMNQQTVEQTMGSPDKRKIIKDPEGQIYDVWLYVTKGLDLGQTEYILDNYTPLIFREGQLTGWGKRYYEYLFDIRKKREKVKEELRQKYTNDRDEWPPNEHKLIPPPPKEEVEKSD